MKCANHYHYIVDESVSTLGAMCEPISRIQA